MKSMAPGAKQCFIWLDFGCMDQDGNPAGELKQLDEIVRQSDCIFTPIYGENRNKAITLYNHYEGYHASAWNEGPYSYMQRGWCRVEMLYAANIPLIEYKARAERCFEAGMKFHMLNGVRPHLLYGTSESKGMTHIVLPPLQNSYYEKLNPLKGNLTVASDRAKIEELHDNLKPHFKVVAKVGYEDGYDSYGKKSCQDIFRCVNGAVYEGDLIGSKMTTGQMFLADANLTFTAVFSGGDDIVDGYWLYHFVLTNADGSIFRKGKSSNGKFIV